MTYVTTTVYFVIRDIRNAFDINNDWRLKVDGHIYVINTVTVLDDTVPKYLEIEATKIGGFKLMPNSMVFKPALL